MKKNILKSSLKKIISPVVDEMMLCTYLYYKGYSLTDLSDELIIKTYENEEYKNYSLDIKNFIKEYERLKRS